ncbi:MAG: hypothetical protein QF463_04405 [Vicinamibacterales bacterium]|nr:hypothetical protein [Vicinamibacterales bacterium]
MFGRRLPSLALSFTVLLQIGCGNAPSPDAPEPAPESATPSDAAAVEAAAPAPDVLATTSSSIDGVDVDLLYLSRTGDAITVRWQYRTTLAEGVSLDAGDDPYALTREAYLFDDTNQKKYMVVEDDAGRPVAAEHAQDEGAGVVVTAEAPVVAWAKFPAPPDDTDRLTVHLPGIEPFENVAVGQ